MESKIIEKLIEMFGDSLVDFEVYPRIFQYQVSLAKFQLKLENPDEASVPVD